jgi:IS4 transposase
VTLKEAKPNKAQPIPAPLKCRIIITRAAESAAARERARIRRSRVKYGVTPLPDTLAMAEVVMFATNLAAEDWPPDKLLTLYRLRWQIELAFKTLKSTFDMRRVPAKEPKLARTWILANLAAALLANLLSSALQRAIPPSEAQHPRPQAL